MSLNACRPGDNTRVGGKAVGLGRLLDGGFPVPPGFAVTTDAYRDTLKETDLLPQIAAHLETFDGDSDNTTIADNVQRLFASLKLPDAIAADVTYAYRQLSGGDDVPVAVRSSAT